MPDVTQALFRGVDGSIISVPIKNVISFTGYNTPPQRYTEIIVRSLEDGSTQTFKTKKDPEGVSKVLHGEPSKLMIEEWTRQIIEERKIELPQLRASCERQQDAAIDSHDRDVRLKLAAVQSELAVIDEQEKAFKQRLSERPKSEKIIEFLEDLSGRFSGEYSISTQRLNIYRERSSDAFSRQSRISFESAAQKELLKRQKDIALREIDRLGTEEELQRYAAEKIKQAIIEFRKLAASDTAPIFKYEDPDDSSRTLELAIDHNMDDRPFWKTIYEDYKDRVTGQPTRNERLANERRIREMWDRAYVLDHDAIEERRHHQAELSLRPAWAKEMSFAEYDTYRHLMAQKGKAGRGYEAGGRVRDISLGL